MGSEGLKRALERNNLLHYAYNQIGKDFLDISKLQSAPIFYVRGFLVGRFPLVIRGGDQFKAAWQSESYFTRHGDLDVSTPKAVENQKYFNMYFVCSETDADKYAIPTYFLPSWADTSIFNEYGTPNVENDECLGFIGVKDGREDFLNQDIKGLIVHKNTELRAGDPVGMTHDYAQLISSYKMLVAPPGRCFNGMCGRAFEIMACRRLCFQWLNEDTMFRHMTFFKDGEDIIYFKTYDELVEKFKYYLNHDDEVWRIATNGYNKVREFHNENVRAKYIVDCMEEEHKKWLQEQQNVPSDVQELALQIAKR